jgi:hypothetical protein
VTSYTCAEQVWQHFADKHVDDQSTVVQCELCSKRFPSDALVNLHFKLSHEPKVKFSFLFITISTSPVSFLSNFSLQFFNIPRFFLPFYLIYLPIVTFLFNLSCKAFNFLCLSIVVSWCNLRFKGHNFFLMFLDGF